MTDAVATLEWGPVTARAPIEIDVVQTGWRPWELIFKHHHYLPDAGPMAYGTGFTGFDRDTGEPVCFMGISGMSVGGGRAARCCRLVTVPEYQGAGIGLRFLNTLAAREWAGEGYIGAPVSSYMHTAAPALVSALTRSPDWHQVSAALTRPQVLPGPTGMGGHWRSVAGFRYGSRLRVKRKVRV